MLQCAVGWQEPSSGEVLFDGLPYRDQRAETRAAVAVALGAGADFPGLTVREHLELMARAHGDAGPGVLVASVLAELDLSHVAEHFPFALSQGQRRRLGLASCFVRPRRLIVLDEPEQNLDRRGRAWLAETDRGRAKCRRRRADGLPRQRAGGCGRRLRGGVPLRLAGRPSATATRVGRPWRIAARSVTAVDNRRRPDAADPSSFPRYLRGPPTGGGPDRVERPVRDRRRGGLVRVRSGDRDVAGADLARPGGSATDLGSRRRRCWSARLALVTLAAIAVGPVTVPFEYRVWVLSTPLDRRRACAGRCARAGSDRRRRRGARCVGGRRDRRAGPRCAGCGVIGAAAGFITGAGAWSPRPRPAGRLDSRPAGRRWPCSVGAVALDCLTLQPSSAVHWWVVAAAGWSRRSGSRAVAAHATAQIPLPRLTAGAGLTPAAGIAAQEQSLAPLAAMLDPRRPPARPDPGGPAADRHRADGVGRGRSPAGGAATLRQWSEDCRADRVPYLSTPLLQRDRLVATGAGPGRADLRCRRDQRLSRTRSAGSPRPPVSPTSTGWTGSPPGGPRCGSPRGAAVVSPSPPPRC